MASTLAQLETKVVSRLRPDVVAPVITDIDNLTTEVFQIWANELSIELIKKIADPEELQALVVLDHSITLTSGVGNLPADYAHAMALKCGVTLYDVSRKRNAQIYYDPREFARFDLVSFATTPTVYFPQSLIAQGKISVKPTTITTAYLDYYKKHLTISSSQGTVWSDFADNVFVLMLAQRYYEAFDKPDMAALQSAEIQKLLAA